MTLEARLWAKVDRAGAGECWPFRGATAGCGYGAIHHEGGPIGAHRAAFFVTFGWWPPTVLHVCDNPPCCNPAHLRAGTQAENVADAKAKGRLRGGSPPGERHHRARLTDRQVAEIRRLGGRFSMPEIGRRFGISKTHVRRILRHESRPKAST